MIAPDITCVVESGKPTCEAERITAAPAPWAAKPCAGSILMILRAHRADDPPAAEVGAERDRGRRGHDHPRRDVGVGAQVPVGDQREEDDPHRLLRVVGAVREREQRARGELPEPEAARDDAGRLAADDPVGDEDRQRRRRRNASTGATSAGTATFSISPLQSTALGPSAASVAPTMPPISACEDDEGRPNHQVTRFQAIAPIRPAKTVSSVIDAGVDDALGDRRGDGERQERADEVQASRPSPRPRAGDIARVETDVAIALAVSWKPLVKSKASAVPTTIQRMTSECTATGS